MDVIKFVTGRVNWLKKNIKYLGITVAALLTVVPIAMPIINARTEMTVEASENQNNSLDFNDPDGGLVNLRFYVNVDGQEKEVSTKIVVANNVGDIDTQPAPILDGYVATQKTISIERTTTGYRILQIPTYIKSNPDDAPKTATTKTFYEVINVRNKAGNYCPLVGFSTETGKIFSVPNRALANDTEWYSDKIKTYDGAKYFRVATNEWVKETYFHTAHS